MFPTIVEYEKSITRGGAVDRFFNLVIVPTVLTARRLTSDSMFPSPF